MNDYVTPNQLSIMIEEDYGNASIEDLITALRLIVERDREGYVKSCPPEELPHPLVLECFDAAAQHLADASFAIYASYK